MACENEGRNREGDKQLTRAVAGETANVEAVDSGLRSPLPSAKKENPPSVKQEWGDAKKDYCVDE